MNRDIYRIFEAYSAQRNKLISENVPVEFMPGYSGSGEEVTAEFPELSKGKYDLTPDETKEVFKLFVSKFKSQGGKSPKLYKDFHEMEIAPIIRAVKPSISGTNSKYCSRVLYNALKKAGVLKDERDGEKGVKMEKAPSDTGIEKLTTYTFKKADELGKEEAPAEQEAAPQVAAQPEGEVEDGAGGGIDDPIMKRFWYKLLGEGDFSREELIRMYIQQNPETDEGDAKMSVSSLISTGYLTKTGPNTFVATDPEEKESSQEEGEGTGEVTSGIDLDEIDNDNEDALRDIGFKPDYGEGRPFNI